MRLGVPTPAALWRLAAHARRIQPTLIQGWMYHGNVAAEFASAFLPGRVPVLWNVRHSLYDLKYEKWLTARVIRLGAFLSKRPARILYNSAIAAEQHEAIGYRADHRVVIPNGFDTEQFAPSEESRRQIRDELGLPQTTRLIGLIARFHEMKGHETFLRAAAMISSEYPDVHFLLAGFGVEETNEDLMELIHTLCPGNRVHVLGIRSDTPVVTAALDIASSSSWFGEAFSNAIGEAMSCSVCCAVTDVGESAQLVADTGRVVQPRDPAAMASAWRSFLDLSEEERARLGARGRERIIQEFSIERIASLYQSLYRGVSGS
jgi:glycosyltransferase involved in cell wall biosynthesis